MNRNSIIKHWPTVAISLLTSVAIVSCATSPTGRTQLKLVSDAQMEQMGAAAFSQLKQKTPPTSNGAVSGYVECIARAITREVAADQQWEVRTFDDDQINAFALPGGKIGVYTGLINKATENQDQLAAVVGHEVAHVLAGHSAARVSNDMAAQLGVSVLAGATGYDPQLIGMGANLLLLLPYGRGDESEADILGLNYMARAGFDPRQAVNLWVNMARASEGNKPPEFLSTHPAETTRIRDIQRELPNVMPLYEQSRAQGKRPNCRR